MSPEPPPKRTSAEVASLVSAELSTFQDPRLRETLSGCLVEPRSHLRLWDWSASLTEYECWMVAESKVWDYGIVYSDAGFGPANPWGLVFLSANNIGADYCWYPRLEEAFAESRFTNEPETTA